MSFLHVKVYHGLCNSFNFGNVNKPQRLAGLKTRLQKLGFAVEFYAVKFIDYCVLEMCGYEVFRCKLQHLKFNTSWERDVVCQRAVDAVMKASVKLRMARATLWCWILLENDIFYRGKYYPQDHWPTKMPDVHAPCTECFRYCDREWQHYDKTIKKELEKIQKLKVDIKPDDLNLQT